MIRISHTDTFDDNGVCVGMSLHIVMGNKAATIRIEPPAITIYPPRSDDQRAPHVRLDVGGAIAIDLLQNFPDWATAEIVGKEHAR